MKRYGAVIEVREDKIEDYNRLHAAVWPGVADMITQCNIRNYSIYLRRLPDGNFYLFSYFEYIGTDLQADMKAMADDPETQRWWKETDPCQIQLPGRQPGANWSDMEMVFFTE